MLWMDGNGRRWRRRNEAEDLTEDIVPQGDEQRARDEIEKEGDGGSGRGRMQQNLAQQRPDEQNYQRVLKQLLYGSHLLILLQPNLSLSLPLSLSQ